MRRALAQQHGLLGDLEIAEADAQLMQLEGPANAQPAVGGRKIVKQQQLPRTKQDALLDRFHVQASLGEVVLLLGEGFELHAAKEAGITGAR